MGIPDGTAGFPLSPLGEACLRMDLTALHEVMEKIGYKDDEGAATEVCFLCPNCRPCDKSFKAIGCLLFIFVQFFDRVLIVNIEDYSWPQSILPNSKKFYQIAMLAVIFHGSECCALKKQEKNIKVTKMRMLKWMHGFMRKDKS